MVKDAHLILRDDAIYSDDENDNDDKSAVFRTRILSLPSEILLNIFSFLPRDDLNTCILVCSKFRDIGTDPDLWSMFIIPCMKISQQQGLSRILDIIQLPRFKKMKSLDLNRVYHGFLRKGVKSPAQEKSSEDRDKFLSILKVASKLPLTFIDLSYNKLASLSSPEFLASLVLNVQDVSLFATCRGAGANLDFIVNILERLSDRCALSNLNLGACDLDTLPSTLMIKLNNISSISMEGVIMTLEQARVFLTEMSTSTKIKRFNIGSQVIVDVETFTDVFENVEPMLVASALNNIENITYNKLTYVKEDCCDISPDIHLLAFLEEMGRSTKVKQLDMEENNYFFVPPEVVGKAFNKLESLHLKPSPFTTSAQICSTLKLMAKGTNVRHLTLEYENLSWLNPGLLARAVVQVEEVVLKCALSKAHLMAILSQIGEHSKLRKLDLGKNDLSRVPGFELEGALQWLRRGGEKVEVMRIGKKMILI